MSKRTYSFRKSYAGKVSRAKRNSFRRTSSGKLVRAATKLGVAGQNIKTVGGSLMGGFPKI